ncbi:MAG: DUF1588 domain-containing protein [Myxococcota bacterium]|nr:DUF1588 domain-containing protein [Myxococcota bacterium]
MKRASLWALTALFAAAACAQPGQGDNPAGGTPDAGMASLPDAGLTGVVPAIAVTCANTNMGRPLLRLLNRAEFDRTLSDVFPQLAPGQWTDSLPSATVSVHGFDNDNSATVGNQLASALLDTALSVATAVTGTSLTTLLPCASSSADRTCAETFLTQYGRRLFRRPVTPAEHDRYLGFFDSAVAKSDFKTALKWMTAGLIQSPNVVYRREIGTDNGNGTRTLSAHEIAAEIAYTYTGSTPNDDLLAKADSGNLGDPVALAKTLLATDRGKEALQHFFEGYLGYTGVTSIQKPNRPEFSGLSADMIQETRHFIDDVAFQKGGGLKDLLTAPSTNPSQKLAQYYLFPSPAGDYASIVRPSGRGIGILAQGSFLATHATSDSSSPTQRGLFAFSRLLCNAKPSPPPSVPQITPPQPGKVTTRQRYEQQHASGGACATCHKLWDPIGFGFEHYDETGRYRPDENGLAIDSSAAVPNLDGTPLFTFADEEHLVSGLAAQPVSYQCFAGYLATYAFGTDEACLGAGTVAGMQSGSMGIASAFAALAGTPHFTQRSSQ